MVKVVIAGGAGNVAREIIDGILAKKKHDVTILTRNDVASSNTEGIKWIKVDYHRKQALTEILNGNDVVLSFVLPFSDPEDIAQKNLIDASVQAGVKRFASSEWATSSYSGIPAYAGKDRVREYLEAVNQDNNVLEYTLFQPGLFLNYFTHPYPSGKHLAMSVHYIDFENRQAIIVDEGNQPVTFTLVQDLASVVTEALDYQQKWPTVGGVQGWQTTSADVVKLGERLRELIYVGSPFNIYRVSSVDLEAEGLKTPWVPLIEHPAIPKSGVGEFSRTATGDAMKGISRGAWTVSDEWNKLLPNFKFTNPETFLRKYWEGKV